MKRGRRKCTAAFKSKVALEALREDRPVSAVRSRHVVHLNQVRVEEEGDRGHAGNVLGQG